MHVVLVQSFDSFSLPFIFSVTNLSFSSDSNVGAIVRSFDTSSLLLVLLLLFFFSMVSFNFLLDILDKS